MGTRFDHWRRAKSHVQCYRYGAILLVVVCSLVIPQMAVQIEADQCLSDESGSLMDHVLVGLISVSRKLLLLVDQQVPI